MVYGVYNKKSTKMQAENRLWILVNLNLMDEMVGQQTPKKNLTTIFWLWGGILYTKKN